MSFALSFAGLLQVYRDDTQAAEQLMLEVIPLCNDYGILVFLAHARVIEAWARCADANDDASRSAFVQRIAEFRALGARCFLPLWEAHLAEVYCAAGDLDGCAVTLARAQADADASGEA